MNRRVVGLLAALHLGLSVIPGWAASVQPIRYYPGPYTIRGMVVTPEGKPLPGYPLRLLPARPERGLDVNNEYYRIPGRADHYTVTGPDGRFAMTGVVDYPQVSTHTYRLVRAGSEADFPYDQDKKTDTVELDRCADPSRVFDLVIRVFPVAQVKIVLRDRAGRPLTGARVVSLVTEGGRPHTTTGRFVDGEICLPLLDCKEVARGRVAVLRYSTVPQAFQEAAKHGDFIGVGKPLTYGAVGQREVLFVPGRTLTVEFTVD